MDTTEYLQMGFDSLFFSREHMNDLSYRLSTKRPEMIWRASQDITADLFTGNVAKFSLKNRIEKIVVKISISQACLNGQHTIHHENSAMIKPAISSLSW